MAVIWLRRRLSDTQDRRRKLTKAQVAEVERLYATGRYSVKEICARFGVSEACIRYHVNSKAKERARENNREWQRKNKLSKEEKSKRLREYYCYKKSLYLAGELVDDGEKPAQMKSKEERHAFDIFQR